MAPRNSTLHKHIHFCTHSNLYFGNYNNHLPIYHTLTLYKVHDILQEVLAYKSDDNMVLGGIFHNMCMVVVEVEVVDMEVDMEVVDMEVDMEVEVVHMEVDMEVVDMEVKVHDTLTFYHTLTFYKVHDILQEVLAYNIDDNMVLGGIFHNMCMVVVEVEVEVVDMEVKVEVESQCT
ncbi:hypothetical protein NC652_015495 [Populus alba x Populus x berolinensis]|nr:hypothetical protein NC652_015495 [Populus alba x Populus x berolinensis]